MNDYFDEQEVDELEEIVLLARETGDTDAELAALEKIDFIVADVRKKITPEIEAQYPYPEKPEGRVTRGRGGVGYQGMDLTNWNEQKKQVDKMRELAATDPNLAALISEMSPTDKLLTGIGAGMVDVSRGAKNFLDYTPYGAILPDVEIPNPTGMAALEGVSPMAEGGRMVGQAAPFLPAGIGASALPSLGGRVAASSLVGGVEGATIASGTGGDVATGALVGAAVGGSSEVVGTAFNRIASPLVRKWFGESAKAVDETGAPTPELIYAAQKEGVTVDDLIKQTEDPRAFTQEAIKSGQIGAYEDIAQGVQVDPTKMEALKTLGINPEQAPIAIAALTNQQKVQELAGAVAASPASAASEELTNYSKLLSQKADELIVQMGGEIDKAEANQSIKSGLEGLISETKAAESELYKRINDQVGNPIVNTKPLLADILKSASKSSQGVKGLSEVERKVYQKLQGKPTYFDIDNLRREIGAAIGGDTDAFKNSTSAKLDEMYAKLTQLQEGVANQVGGAAGLWKEAKDLGLKRFELQDSARLAFNKDLGGSLIPKVERALTQAGKADVANLKKVMDKLPKHLQERAVATALNGVFTSSRGVDRGFTATNLATFGENLKRSPTAQNLLKSYLPEGGYDRLQAMIELSNGLANVQRKITRTGIVPEELKNFQNTGKIVKALYKTAQVMDAVPLGGTISRPARLAGTAVQASEPERLANIDVVDNLLTSNQFKAAAMAHAEGDAKKIAYLDAALKKTPAYKKYIKSIPKSNAATIASVGLIPFLVQQEESQ
jgi:hypothetical protein